MIRFVSTIDDRDKVLGQYFNESNNRLKQIIADLELTTSHLSITSQICNEAYMVYMLPKKMDLKPFVFVAFTHGNAHSLLCNGTAYLHQNNAHVFRGSLIYSTACSAGSKLGQNLIDAGCKTFIGYNAPSWAFVDDQYRDITLQCEFSGLSLFITNELTIKEAFEKMKSYYNHHIDRLNLCNDLLARANLVRNRESLVLLGCETVKLSDFNY